MTVCYVWLLISSFLSSKRKPQEKGNAKRSKTIPAETISPASITRRLVNLVHGDGEDGASTSTIWCFLRNEILLLCCGMFLL
jgi:hypothetical protein